MTDDTPPSNMGFYALDRTVASALNGYKGHLGGVSAFNVFQTRDQKSIYAQLVQGVEQPIAPAIIKIKELAKKHSGPS